MPGGKLIRIVRKKGPWEIGRRAIYYSLNAAGRGLLRGSDRFAPDHTMALTAEDSKLLASNQDLKGKYKGRRCFVLGNGPSLASEDLSPLAGEITLAMNRFFDNPIIEEWQPTFYCLSDPAFFNGAKPTQAMAENQQRLEKSIFFVPLHFRREIEETGVLSSNQRRYILFRGELRNTELKTVDFASFVPSVWSVSELCILVALYLGCSPIYLLGLDHDWLAHRAAYGDWQKYSYKFIMEFQHKLWCGYERIASYAQANGVSIINLTRGSYLDIFESKDYESVVQIDRMIEHFSPPVSSTA